MTIAQLISQLRRIADPQLPIRVLDADEVINVLGEINASLLASAGGGGSGGSQGLDITQAPFLLDKTGATNCSPGLASAIAAGHRTIYFPKGTYRFDTKVQLPAGTTLIGEGPHVTEIDCRDDYWVECLRNTNSTYTLDWSRCQITGFSLDMDKGGILAHGHENRIWNMRFRQGLAGRWCIELHAANECAVWNISGGYGGGPTHFDLKANGLRWYATGADDTETTAINYGDGIIYEVSFKGTVPNWCGIRLEHTTTNTSNGAINNILMARVQCQAPAPKDDPDGVRTNPDDDTSIWVKTGSIGLDLNAVQRSTFITVDVEGSETGCFARGRQISMQAGTTRRNLFMGCQAFNCRYAWQDTNGTLDGSVGQNTFVPGQEFGPGGPVGNANGDPGSYISGTPGLTYKGQRSPFDTQLSGALWFVRPGNSQPQIVQRITDNHHLIIAEKFQESPVNGSSPNQNLTHAQMAELAITAGVPSQWAVAGGMAKNLVPRKALAIDVASSNNESRIYRPRGYTSKGWNPSTQTWNQTEEARITIGNGEGFTIEAGVTDIVTGPLHRIEFKDPVMLTKWAGALPTVYGKTWGGLLVNFSTRTGMGVNQFWQGPGLYTLVDEGWEATPGNSSTAVTSWRPVATKIGRATAQLGLNGASYTLDPHFFGKLIEFTGVTTLTIPKDVIPLTEATGFNLDPVGSIDPTGRAPSGWFTIRAGLNDVVLQAGADVSIYVNESTTAVNSFTMNSDGMVITCWYSRIDLVDTTIGSPTIGTVTGSRARVDIITHGRATGLLGAASPPPPPPPPVSPPAGSPPPVTSPPVVSPPPPPAPSTFTPDFFIDTVGGDDKNNGTSSATPKRTWTAIDSIVTGGSKVGIKRGSSFNQQILLTSASKWINTQIGAYGDSGADPVFRNAQYITTGIARHNGNVWRASLPRLAQSTSYASGRNTRATSVTVNNTQWLYWHVASANEVNEAMKFYHDEGNGVLYFFFSGTPTEVIVPVSDPIVGYATSGIVLQDITVEQARGHGFTMDRCSFTLRRVKVRKCGLNGIYFLARPEATIDGITIEDCDIEDCHAVGIGLSASNAGNTPQRVINVVIRRNKLRRCCIGPPWITSGVTSDDYYSAAIKVYTGLADTNTWGWTVDVYQNTIEDIGTLDRALTGDMGQGIWFDTVNPKAVNIYGNLIQRCRAAGIFVELTPNAGVTVRHNYITECGKRHTFWSGGICLGRGTRNTLVHHNTIFQCDYAGLVVQGLANANTSPGAGSVGQTVFGNTLRDNIVVAPVGQYHIVERPVQGSNVFNKNILWPTPLRVLYSDNQQNSGATYDTLAGWHGDRSAATGSIQSDPEFINPPLDLRLKTTSPAIDASSVGDNIGAYDGDGGSAPPVGNETTAIRINGGSDPAGDASNDGPFAKVKIRINGTDATNLIELSKDVASGAQNFDTTVPYAKSTITSLAVVYANDYYRAGPPVEDRNAAINTVTIDPGTNGVVLTGGTSSVWTPSGTGSAALNGGHYRLYGPGVLSWSGLSLGSSPPPPPPPAATGSGGAIVRSGNRIQQNGVNKRGMGWNFHPISPFHINSQWYPVWSEDTLAYVVSQLAIMKGLGYNWVRICIAPGEYKFWRNTPYFFVIMDGVINEAKRLEMGIEINWWTVSKIDEAAEDDSFFIPAYRPTPGAGYDPSMALATSFWTAIANRYKTATHVTFSLWDEPIKSSPSHTWQNIQPYINTLIAAIRATGALNFVWVPGNHYSRNFTELFSTHPVVDASDQWGIKFHEFQAGEPGNEIANAMHLISNGLKVFEQRPFNIGGIAFLETDTAMTGNLLTLWNDIIIPHADVVSIWSWSAWNGPPPQKTGYPNFNPITWNPMGTWFNNNLLPGLTPFT